MSGPVSRSVPGFALLLLPLAAVAASPIAFPAPIDTGLAGAVRVPPPVDEQLTVRGSRLRLAPTPFYGDALPPWEAARAIRDPRTGASTTAFGNAFNLGAVMGSDERSSETGGSFLAPRHN